MFNQPYPTPSSSTKPGPSTSLTNTQSSSKQQPMIQPSPAASNPMSMNPYMDPAYFFYAQAAMAAAAYGMGMMQYPPYGMGMMPGGMPGMPFPSTNRHHLPDDQQSIQSFHFDIDTRSEKKMPYSNRAQSIAGDPVSFKTEPIDPKNSKPSGFLLMEDPNTVTAIDNTAGVGLIESVNVAAAKENRMTPLTHQLPHVRASFALNAIIKVRANDPCEGQPALVDIINLGDMMEHFLSNLKNMKSTEGRRFAFFS